VADELLTQVFQTVTRIAKSIENVRGIVSGIYQPTPSRGLKDRPNRPFSRQLFNHPINPDPLGLGNLQFPIYTSPDLDTKGYTAQNAYVVLEITDQAVLVPNDTVRIEGVLLGAYNSAFVELARQPIIYTGPGSYPIPLLAAIDSLSTAVHFRLDAMAFPARQLTITIDGMLVAGPLV